MPPFSLKSDPAGNVQGVVEMVVKEDKESAGKDAAESRWPWLRRHQRPVLVRLEEGMTDHSVFRQHECGSSLQSR
ncbi:hypothetical protein BAE39_30255 [Mesorhizobium loti]|uniref:Uncharacterized protein n=1 Tax=Rhizobium loti TaxID=381 RepID=A0A1A5QRJ3_RHILI|nr:hypothetical protein BAE39_30255 [Mesorhizobium loti]OBQ70311.1 hypothetical protein A8145_28615 [Mesorhizobium loti]QKC73160.1 hypothetical protein EB815_31420 [Mesorhizobium loti]